MGYSSDRLRLGIYSWCGIALEGFVAPRLGVHPDISICGNMQIVMIGTDRAFGFLVC